MTARESRSAVPLREHPSLRRRRGGATASTLTDLLRSAAWTRNWLVLVLILAALLAVILAAATQTVVPWVVYPAI